MWWLVASALAGDLYATDWTSGVDGTSRTAVAQVVRAHQDEIYACFAGEAPARIEVRFAWERGRPVRIEVPDDNPFAECVRREISTWRGAVTAPGPYAWEFALPEPGPAVPTTGWTIHTQPPRKGRLSAPSADGYTLSLWYEVHDHRVADAFIEVLTERLPSFAECPPTTLTRDIEATWTAVDGKLTRGRATTLASQGDVAQCLVDAGEGLPYAGGHPVTLRFSYRGAR